MLRKTEAALQDEKLSEQMRTAYQENVDVLKKRLDNLARAETNLKTLEARLIRVENSIMLIQEQALTRQDPAFIEAEVNVGHCRSDLRRADAWVAGSALDGRCLSGAYAGTAGQGRGRTAGVKALAYRAAHGACGLPPGTRFLSPGAQ